MTKHTQEPWVDQCEGADYSVWHRGPQGAPHPDAEDPIAVHLSADDARRIVACVNACAGIPTEALEEVASRDGLEARLDALALCCSPKGGKLRGEGSP